MKFIEGQLYHIYNKGNNNQQIFFKKENYLYFLKKVRKYIYPNCDILSYCLMPNHFNFLIYANSKTVSFDHKNRNFLSEGFKILLSSYAKAINVQENRTGSLFTQNTHSKNVSVKSNQAVTCIRYIHQNPKLNGLTEKLEDWEFSSFRDYCGLRNGTICNKNLTYQLLNIDKENFYEYCNQLILKDDLKRIF